MKQVKKNYTYAIGRRKGASARVRLFKGDKENTVNEMLIGKYFPGQEEKSMWQKPFVITETLGNYYITAKVAGGGKKSQLKAIVLAISNALSKENTEKRRKTLKKEGLLTRDSRERERRKIGTGGRARRKKQSPKR